MWCLPGRLRMFSDGESYPSEAQMFAKLSSWLTSALLTAVVMSWLFSLSRTSKLFTVDSRVGLAGCLKQLRLDELGALWNKDFLENCKPVHEDPGAALNKVISASTVVLISSVVLEAMDMKLCL